MADNNGNGNGNGENGKRERGKGPRVFFSSTGPLVTIASSLPLGVYDDAIKCARERDMTLAAYFRMLIVAGVHKDS